MTTVIALAREGSVFMAADSCNNVYERPIIGGARKIARLKVGDTGAEALIGFSGNGALTSLIPRLLTLGSKPDRYDLDDLRKWAQAAAEAITDIATDARCLEGGKLDSTLILGHAGHVWTITDNQAIPHIDGVAAVGSGEGPAIGAVDAILELRSARMAPLDHVSMVRLAVSIACVRDKHSAPPIQVETLDEVAV